MEGRSCTKGIAQRGVWRVKVRCDAAPVRRYGVGAPQYRERAHAAEGGSTVGGSS